MGERQLLAQNARVLNEVLAMIQANPLGALALGFVLGRQVTEAVNGISSTPLDRLLDTLIRVANGDDTLVHRGGELQRTAANPADVERVRRENQHINQVAARLILDHFRSEASGSSPDANR